MNKNRRQKLRQIVDALQSIVNDLDDIKMEEDEARNNMPENLEGSEIYEESENCSDVLEDVMSDLNEIMGNISEIT